MSVLATNEWLKDYIKSKKNTRKEDFQIQQDFLCKSLTSYFQDATAYDIHLHLLNHGMFAPSRSDKEVIKAFFTQNYWNKTTKLISYLRKKWDGPDVPIMIFPSDHQNTYLQMELHGVNGLSYLDKCILFLPKETDNLRLKALVTHEYNHVCRLQALEKSESELNLLDGIVLEGLAEYAVLDLVGEKYLGKWTSLYDTELAKKYWEKWLSSNLSLKKSDERHELFMYGKGNIPKWLGYNAGFHLVSSYTEKHETSMNELLALSSEVILEGSLFSDN
ncbi:DUF2268 domain-containing protein [Radiobacillus sp. PE A8.2]|uniref:DUF2268 domain-containing protein n=1 Tax=Radiobacillus sp. PE A8.2 TaxID=3380349 RepID=UPI003890A0A8